MPTSGFLLEMIGTSVGPSLMMAAYLRSSAQRVNFMNGWSTNPPKRTPPRNSRPY